MSGDPASVADMDETTMTSKSIPIDEELPNLDDDIDLMDEESVKPSAAAVAGTGGIVLETGDAVDLDDSVMAPIEEDEDIPVDVNGEGAAAAGGSTGEPSTSEDEEDDDSDDEDYVPESEESSSGGSLIEEDDGEGDEDEDVVGVQEHHHHHSKAEEEAMDAKAMDELEAEDDQVSFIGGIGGLPGGSMFPALHKLVLQNSIDDITAYLKETGTESMYYQVDGLGRSPLHLALLYGLTHSARALLEADVNYCESAFERHVAKIEVEGVGHLKIIDGKIVVVDSENCIVESSLENLSESIRSKIDLLENNKFIRSLAARPFDDLPTVHLAMSVAPFDVDGAIDMIRLLANHPGVDMSNCLDYYGRNVLHICALSGAGVALYDAITKGMSEEQVYSLLSQRDRFGWWPLHYAIDNKDPSGQMVECLSTSDQLVDQQIDGLHIFIFAILHYAWRQAFQIAVLMGGLSVMPDAVLDRAGSVADAHGTTAEFDELIAALAAGQSGLAEDFEERALGGGSTLVVTDSGVLNHMGVDPEGPHAVGDLHSRLKRFTRVVENPSRVEVLTGGVTGSTRGTVHHPEFASKLFLETSVSDCPMVDILRVHDWNYVEPIISKCEALRKQAIADGETNINRRTMPIDKTDTSVTVDSWAAARKAAGCAVLATDQVCSGTGYRNAMAIIRPPGHHVASRGAVNPELEDEDEEGDGSQGFCLLNNVAISAAYALSNYRSTIQRVAIVDFDVHHGNGTEAIVRGLSGPVTVRKQMRVAGCDMTITRSSLMPWVDPSTDRDNVFFASVHRFDGRFYPRSGPTSRDDVEITARGKGHIPFTTDYADGTQDVLSDHGQADRNIMDVGLTSDSKPEDLRKAFTERILPALVQFSPDLILISAGFDAHLRDRLAQGECDFSEREFYWMTEQIMAVAAQTAECRVVSVLEGGYNTKAQWLSPLSQSVAAHLRALMTVNARKPEVASDGAAAVVLESSPADDQPDGASANKRPIEDEEELELFGEDVPDVKRPRVEIDSSPGLPPQYGPDSFDFIRSIHSGRKSKVWVAKIEEDVCGLKGEICVVKMIDTSQLRTREQVQHVWEERDAAEMARENPQLRERCCVLLGSYKAKGYVCLVLSAMRGEPLHHHFQQAVDGHFTVERTKFYIHYIATTLQVLHEQGYVYRDLKASNVLLVEGRPVLIDFGMCKKIIKTGRTYSVCGTYHAMAPEVRSLSWVDHDLRATTTDGYSYAVDFWSLGVLLVELLTGKPPFGYRDGDIGDLFKLSKGSPQTIRWAGGFEPTPELTDLVEQLLQPDPSKRLTDWEAVLNHPFFDRITDDMPPPEWDSELGIELWDTDLSEMSSSASSSSSDVFRDF
ncbi:hypothetical protein FOL47_010166 [Perkinsus chesapeaki]|uniref:Protein kinase domain-containing protein n=1 Tax=Perkinsus chesapeaki TaxID=330153 RepID=A0A7J6L3L1_PERCH|nr:hypothetical protein FOL47_010166 [Perkinsus chesapeaki]